MSYAQFLSELNRDESLPNGQCVQEFIAQRDGECPRHYTPNDLPEHREDEANDPDPIFGNGPDSFLPAPEGLSSLQQIEFQDLQKVAGRVVGRHESIIKTPWYMTSQFVQKRLRCTVDEAKQLVDCWSILDATEAMVLDFIAQSQKMGVEEAIEYYDMLAKAAGEAEYSDPSDAMEQHLESYNDTPDTYDLQSAEAYEHALLNEDDLDTDELWSEFDAWQEGSSDASAGVDIACLQTEGWHLMDDADDDQATWLDRQPSVFQVLYHRSQEAKTLAELKALGQKVYALTSWTPTQRSAFWSVWKVRRLKLLSYNMNHISRVRKAVSKIQQTNPVKIPSIGKRLFELSKKNSGFYPEEGWAVIWAAYKQAKSPIEAKTVFNRRLAVLEFIAKRDGVSLDSPDDFWNRQDELDFNPHYSTIDEAYPQNLAE